MGALPFLLPGVAVLSSTSGSGARAALAAPLPTPSSVVCKDDFGCSLLGKCVSGKCECRKGWKGADCGAADLAPLDVTLGYQVRVRLVGFRAHCFALTSQDRSSQLLSNHSDMPVFLPSLHTVHVHTFPALSRRTIACVCLSHDVVGRNILVVAKAYAFVLCNITR